MGVWSVLLVVLGVLLLGIKWALIICGIVWLVRYLKKTNQERQRMRLEIGKLAEEVQLLRTQLKDDKG